MQAWEHLQPVIDRVAPLAFERGLGALTPMEQRVLLVWSYAGTIDNGGHASFLCNSYGDETDATIEALRAMGASAHADNLRVLHRLYPGGRVPRDHAERNLGLSAMTDEQVQQLDACDDAFYRLGSEALFDTLLAYWRSAA